jgi:hypothetical protein
MYVMCNRMLQYNIVRLLTALRINAYIHYHRFMVGVISLIE